MYLLISCAISWLCLVSAFVAAWLVLPTPRSTSDIVVITVVGSAALLFARLGFVSLVTLLIRLLPFGRMRTTVIGALLRIAPTLLRSSVLAAISATLAVQAVHASPLPDDQQSAADHVAAAEAVTAPAATFAPDATLGPGWPTTTTPDTPPPDPGWPSTPPTNRPDSPPTKTPDPPSPESPDSASEKPTSPSADKPSGKELDDTTAVEDPDGPGYGEEEGAGSGGGGGGGTGRGDGPHIVGIGESLWSIAAEHPSASGTTQDIVDDIYTANRKVIGANPNLIMPGQRLEIPS